MNKKKELEHNLENEHEHNEDFEGFTLEDLDNDFSSLAFEMKKSGVTLNSVMEVTQRFEEPVPHFRNYNPTILDFLARANTDEECKEIITYCLKKGEITQDEANKLQEHLSKDGFSTFGTRSSGHYDSKLA
ncbi:MAG: hypothetical protein HeimC2_09080 [Candidatus Heimdallarchaeota archaeon LC_2]|nr:MAG: hypothetical protein HeimC2_09080 [Candidatus Heimdallarchaeota archaeon LC_2]